MSSPSRAGGQVREGTRVVLRDTTASLHNFTSFQASRRKNVGDTLPSAKAAEHEVKVRFVREFVDVGSTTHSAPDSLSSVSSFHSLSSTLSTKSSTGICLDFDPEVRGSAEKLNETIVSQNDPITLEYLREAGTLDDDATPESEPLIFQEILAGVRTSFNDDVNDKERSIASDTEIITADAPEVGTSPERNVTYVEESEEAACDTVLLKEIEELRSELDGNSEELTATKSYVTTEAEETGQLSEAGLAVTDNIDREEEEEVQCSAEKFNGTFVLQNVSTSLESLPETVVKSDDSNIPGDEPRVFHEISSNILQICSKDTNDEERSINSTDIATPTNTGSEDCNCTEINTYARENGLESDSTILNNSQELRSEVNSNLQKLLTTEEITTEAERDPVALVVNNVDRKEERSTEELSETIVSQNDFVTLKSLTEAEHYEKTNSHQQNAALVSINCDFQVIELAAKEIANELDANSDCFTSVTSDEIFQEPVRTDFLPRRNNSQNIDRHRTERLYAKFDSLISNVNMLPQGSAQPINEEQNGKSELPVSNVETPKRNPAIAAIDRLLFFSPITTGTVRKLDEIREKTDELTQESKPDTIPINDINVNEELELVRTTVLRLEEELEKQKKEQVTELEKQKTAFQDKINKLQIVVEEYEKSISRLLTEKERDRSNLEQEKTKLQEELQATNHHLSNTEAAFNDVHLKYERLKGVVSAYKSNESVLKESIQENLETIKSLENRYDQLKTHAMSQLKKANLELVDIRKQHEAETVKLHAMVRKAELKSNSLTESVEQKTKENKELAQILDEVIARVGHQNAE